MSLSKICKIVYDYDGKEIYANIVEHPEILGEVSNNTILRITQSIGEHVTIVLAIIWTELTHIGHVRGWGWDYDKSNELEPGEIFETAQGTELKRTDSEYNNKKIKYVDLENGINSVESDSDSDYNYNKYYSCWEYGQNGETWGSVI